MAAQAVPEEQLLELLLTLKRTTPAEARVILNQQPQIAYALMAMMVNINAVKMEVVQDTLTKYGALSGAAPAGTPQPLAPPAAATQLPTAIPPHIQAQVPTRGSTPTYPQHGAPGGYPPPPGYQGGPPAGPSRGYGTPPPAQVPGFAPPPQQLSHMPGLAHGPPSQLPHAQPTHVQQPHTQPPPTAPAGAPTPALPDALAALPEDQKTLIMRVISMSREEVYQMPPADRDNIIKLRTTLGLPT